MRVKRGNVLRKRHKKILKLAKSFIGARSRIFKVANTAVMKALKYQYRDRRVLKRNMRRLWILRINAAVREYGVSYSKFMNALKKSEIIVNRKMLAELAVNEPEAFKVLFKELENKDRSARFICDIVLVNVENKPLLFEGIVPGRIGLEPDGETGFGYDPIFICDELNKSYASLSEEEKNRVSHRGKALKKLLTYLKINGYAS